MNFSPARSRPALLSRLFALALAVSSAFAFTAALILIVDRFDLPLAQAAGPLTITYTCGPYPRQPTDWSSTCTVPKFNPSLGTLAGVQFTTTAGMSGTIVVENLSSISTATFTAVLTGTINIQHPSGSPTLGSANVITSASGSLSTYDGNADFGGTSGRKFTSQISRTSDFTVTTGLNSWIGSSGSVTMPVNATSQFQCNVAPAGNSLCGSVAEASAAITVTYLYNTPDLSVTKTHAGSFVVGANGVYTIAVRNVGTGPTIGPLTATDTLPVGLSFISFTNPNWMLAGQSGQVLTFTRSNVLAAGSTSNIVVTVGVTNTAIGVVTNTVSVTTTRDLVSTNNATSDPTTVVAGVNLSISKSETPNPVNATASLTYTLSITNTGPSIAPSVRVTDTLPAGMTFGGASGAGWSCAPSGGNVICTRPTLSIGAAPNIVITANAPANGGVITNTATIGSTGFDFFSGDNTTSRTTTVTAISDLALSKSDSPDPVNAGTTLTYTLKVTNTGPSLASNIIVTDTLPAGVTYLGASGSGWSCNPSGGNVICTRNSLAVGAAPALILTVTTPGATPLVNSASVGSAAVDFNPGNNTASASTTVTPVANLSISKSDNPDPVVAGTPLTYTLSITNAGPNTATAVMVTDTLPAGVVFNNVSAPGWTSCNQAGGVVTCSLASLPVGAAPNIVLNVTAPITIGVITNTASVRSALKDLNLADNTASNSTTMASSLADLAISKTGDPDPVNISSPLTYTLKITNTGPNVAVLVRVTDTLPSGVAIVSVTGSGWTCGQSGGVITCTVASLALGPAPDIVIRLISPVIAGQIADVATISSAITDPNPANNSSSASTNVYSLADLSIVKRDSPDPIPTNSILTYTLSVTNSGPNTATIVRVTDTLPPSAIFGGVSAPGWTSCTQGGGVVTCTLASLVVGPAPNIVITVTTPLFGQVMTNTAFVTSTLTDLDPANNTAIAATTVNAADLAISKTDGQTNAVPGSAITYTIVVTNNGPGAVVGATVSDTFSISLTGMTWTCAASAGSSCPASGSGNISATVNLKDGGAATFTAHGTVASNVTGLLINTATVAPSSGATDSNFGNNSATDSDTALPVADLVLTQSDSPDPVAADNFLRYKVTVTNTGPSTATNVVVTDTLTNVSFDFASGSCIESSGLLTCDLGSLAPGVSKTINIYVIPTAIGTLTNTATVASGESDPMPMNNAATESTAVTGFADLSVTKTDGQSSVNAGGPITYTIVVSNVGQHAVAGAAVIDTVPSSIVGATWTCVAASGSSCAAGGSGNLNTPVTVAPGGSVTFTVLGTVAASATGTVSNTATVTAPASVTDTDSGNNSATDIDLVVSVPITGGLKLYLPLVSK